MVYGKRTADDLSDGFSQGLIVGRFHFVDRIVGSAFLVTPSLPYTKKPARRNLRAGLSEKGRLLRSECRWISGLKVEAVEVHDLGPGGDEVAHEFLFSVATAIGFSDGAELGV